MNAILFDSDALLTRFKNIYNPSLKSKLFFEGYILSLRNLEMLINRMEPSYSVNIKIDSFINHFIGNKLVNNLYNSYENNDKDLEKETIELLKKEIKRLNDYIKTVKLDSFNLAKLTRENAKNIMLEYMSEEEINNEILDVYPETDEELFINNQFMPKLIDKTKDGSIVNEKYKAMVKTMDLKF